MLNQQTLSRLRELRLPGMAAAYEEEQRQGNSGQMSFDDRFGLLVEKEWGMRQERRTQRRLKDAHLKEQAWLEDADLDSARGLSREVGRELGTCNWIRAKKNLLVTGPTRTGKTWVSCALANKACREGMTSYYARVPRLVHELAVARLDGSFCGPRSCSSLRRTIVCSTQPGWCGNLASATTTSEGSLLCCAVNMSPNDCYECSGASGESPMSTMTLVVGLSVGRLPTSWSARAWKFGDLIT